MHPRIIFSRVSRVLLFVLLLANSNRATSYPTSSHRRSNSHRGASTQWQAHASAPRPIPISYRLDAWSQYENPEEGDSREGDIRELSESRKTTTMYRQLLWPGGLVRYYLDVSILNEPFKLSVLENAMEDIAERTCIKFERILPDNEGRLPKEGWVNITGNQRGCFSPLGRQLGEPGNLNLDVAKCFRTKGHAIHELLHTLGVFHEHMRADRDEHIDIHWDNVKAGAAFNFRVLEGHQATSYGLPYDYDSIMHYSMTAFSKNRSLPTIVPRKQYVDIGQRDHLSLYDVAKLLITYECNNVNADLIYRKIGHHHRDQLELPNLNMNSNENLRAAEPANDEQSYDYSWIWFSYDPDYW